MNSGTIKFERIDDAKSTLQSWKEVFDVNFFSLVSILKHSLVHLRNSQGKVVFVSSGAAVGGIASFVSLSLFSSMLSYTLESIAFLASVYAIYADLLSFS
jgi:NAD(P)-dependent dehydrogenase (short-subunit alcohol dehydrogenase family)